MFEPLPAQFSFPAAEERILEFWERHGVFQRSLEQRAGAPRFVFYEGPPTANGLPHPGHCLTRAIKDLFPRYQTMCGKLVERKAGWDTHGLPVEVEVCKELGIHTKEEIEAYGVERFVRKCIESVFRYTREWEQMTRRLGFWVNLEEAYVTFHQQYVESVWWSLKTLYERGLLYQGHKVVWWWAQGGTALSAGEVGEGYRKVQDPSVYVKFPLVREKGSRDPGNKGSREGRRPPHLDPSLPRSLAPSLLVWTTTPWTLISNHFAAVGPDVDYVLVHDPDQEEYYYLAAALADVTAGKLKHRFETVATCKGSDLVGLRYTPPFDVYARTLAEKTAARRDGGTESIAWRVVAADFIDLETGTGIVHIAPAYGEVDFNLLQEERKRFVDGLDSIPLLNAVRPDGTFGDEAPEAYRGRWVKDCDKEIMRALRERGVLLHQETIEHEYPFCPRAEDDPLIQYARQSWFVRTSAFKDEFLKNNEKINWLPEHIRAGRFGDFLRNNVDWALSRERYWGTPLPIWRCERCGKMRAIGSFAELADQPGATDEGTWARAKEADPTIPDHLRVHKPYVDAWTFDALCCEGARMRRVPEVIDCWWDAGSMPFAQWGFPHAIGSVQTFAERFPADFISEAIDQTRGWFYGLLAISTLLFGPRVGRSAVPAESRALAEPSDDAHAKAPATRFPPDTEVRRAGAPADGCGGPDLTVAADYPHPYRTCIVLGHVMGEDGLKMSKRKKNYKEPQYVFDTYGADAMRWFFFSAQTPWTSVRFQEANIRDAHREFLVKLYNVLSFFTIYANIDGFVAPPTHGSPARPTHARSELDRWLLSELQRTIRFVRAKLDNFENFPAAGRLNDFVDALSNWYVRRSRERFWSGEKNQDKWDAYHTLWWTLLTLSKLIAPFTPFFAETMYQNLTGIKGTREQGSKEEEAGSNGARDRGSEDSDASHARETSSPRSLDPAIPISVHLCDYPTADESLIDEQLAQEMELVRDIVSLGRAARTAAKLKVRQPLSRAEIILTRTEHTEWLQNHADLIAEELNIKQVEFTAAAEQYVTYQIKPDFKAIGPKFGRLAPQIAAALAKRDPAEVRQELEATGRVMVILDDAPTPLSAAEVEVRLEAKPGWSAAQGRAGVVVVSTALTPELRDEGLCRELIHCVQALRKDRALPYEQRIALYVEAPEPVRVIVRRFADTIGHECLTSRIEFACPPDNSGGQRVVLEGQAVLLGIVPV